MTDYTELVKALRSASAVSTAWEKLMFDAAAAIEALQEQVSMLDKHDTDLHNEGYDVGYYAGRRDWEPKRGEWIWKHRHHGGFKTAKGKCECGRDVYAQIDERYETDDPYCPFCGVMNDSIHLNYCPNCGAKMEVQDGKEN